MEQTDGMEVTMYGGYSYAIGDPETFPSYRAACEAWHDRWSSNGIRKVDGVLWPTWGDMEDDDYAITTENDGLTREQVIAIAEGGPMPFGWEDARDALANYREATKQETEQYLLGQLVIPGAVETEHGLLVPMETDQTEDTDN